MVRSTYSPEGRAIALALALGAALGVKETMLQSIRSIEDSDNSFREHIVSKYTGLRTLIQERYATVRLAQFEEPLGAQARKDVAEDLTKTGADRDEEVWRWASSLLTGVQGWAFVAFRAAETFHGGLEKKDFERAYTHLFGSWLAYLEMSPQDIDNAIDSIRLFGDVWGGVSSSSIRFTVYYPKEIEPEKWFTLIVYVHIPDPHLCDPLRTQFMARVKAGDRCDISFILAVLRSYCGEVFLHDICKEIVALLDANDKLLEATTAVLDATGVVSGEDGMAVAYQREISEIRPWLCDPRENVRIFANARIRVLEQQSADETRRADERIALRRIKYDEEEDD